MEDCMTDEKMHEFTYRITQASRCELVVIMYDVILTDIEDSKKAIGNEKYDESDKSLRHALRFLNELMSTLDYSQAISLDFVSLYSFCNKAMIKAMVSRKADSLDGAVMVFTGLRRSFRKLSENDDSGPEMSNAQSVYAGLTYGKNSRENIEVEGNESNRGFLA
jgi:flagellar protein FliS